MEEINDLPQTEKQYSKGNRSELLSVYHDKYEGRHS